MRTEEMTTNNSQASTFPSNTFTRPPRISLIIYGVKLTSVQMMCCATSGHTAISTRSSISKNFTPFQNTL